MSAARRHDDGPMLTVHSSQPREIAPGTWWLPKCFEMSISGVPYHNHVAPYLIVGSREALLFDTAMPAHWPLLTANLDQVLGARQLDWVVPSHPEVPHCGNLPRLLEKYPGARLAGDVRDYPMYFPQLVDRFVHREEGSVLDLGGGHRFTFLPAPIHDLPTTRWGHEESGGVLFVSDAFGFTHHISDADGAAALSELPVHLSGECGLLGSELDRPPQHEQVAWLNERALFWTRYVEIDPIKAAVEELLTRYPTRLIAPAHGAVIDDLDEVLPIIWDGYRSAYVGAGS